ncbi:MAG: transcriptional regulator [Methanomicrobium sp.]|nr:transcriptional regulator [Methanomicrobium sp.]MBR6446938.1 transcriptional regulator [Methanomicrobium sp.]
MQLPCQQIVWDVIPAIRASIATDLGNMGVSNLEIARMLDIAPSAVSQYRSKKRGYRIEFDEDIKEEIKRIAEDLNSGAEVSVNKRICKICGMIRTDGGCGSDCE